MKVFVVVEGPSDSAAARKVIEHAGLELLSPPIEKRGKTRIDADLAKYAVAARRDPWVIFRDTDTECPVELRAKLQSQAPHAPDTLLIRLAHSMIEAWLLADRVGFADYFHVSEARLPHEPESLRHAKHEVIKICRGSRSRSIRDAMTTTRGEIGPLYVSTLNDFASNYWDVDHAQENCPSLERTLRRLTELAQR